jgi:D-aspartate ligase
VLLASASAGGTISGVRHLGTAGTDVGVVASQHLSAAAWSDYASRFYWAPPESKDKQFVERLLEIGATEPGQILLPTSDQTAWLYTKNAAPLSKYFYVYQPSIASMQRILDKRRLADAAVSAGLAVLQSWDPRNLDHVAESAPRLPYPILIKPRTHVDRSRNDKGVVVYSPSDLIKQYRQFVERERGPRNPLMPDARLPILQRFVNVGSEGVHSITGFVDRTGELFVTRRSAKVLLRSRPVGVGICFESLPPAAGLSHAVRSRMTHYTTSAEPT